MIQSILGCIKMNPIDQTPFKLPNEFSEQISEIIKPEPGWKNNPSQHNIWTSILKMIGIQLCLPNIVLPTSMPSPSDYIQHFVENNFLNFRKIVLKDNWWKRDQGTLLIMTTENEPKLLIPSLIFGYLIYDPEKKRFSKLRHNEKINLIHEAILFYPNLANTKLTIKDLLQFSYATNRRDLWKILISHGLIGLLTLFIPVMTGYLFNDVIPNSDFYGLWQFTLLLLLITVLRVIINLNLFIATSRFKLRTEINLQSAIWTRIFKLPMSFFNLMNSGDIADRANSIEAIQQTLSTSLINGFLGGIFSIFSFAIMYYLSPLLAVILAVLILVLAMTHFSFSFCQMKYFRKIFNIQGKLYGYSFQIFQNISKIKVFNRQHAVFEKWFSPYLQTRTLSLKLDAFSIYLDIIGNSLLVLGTIIIFLFAAKLNVFASFGDYIMFNALYVQFMSAILVMSESSSGLIRLIALYRRVTPILNHMPEDVSNGTKLRDLSGKIELSHIFYRYENLNHMRENMYGDLAYEGYIDNVNPWVLRDFSLTIQPGENVVLAGKSGCGKSTILKLILGLIAPQKGTISIDDYDINIVNKAYFRSQVGVILQSSILYPGTISDNLKIRDPNVQSSVLEIARQIGFDKFLNELPMKLDTILSEGGKNLSMGQRQRLLIIKALIDKPKLVIFDESTSALDNESQSKVYDYLKKLKITRIQTAHRISSMQQSDKVIFIEHGQVIAMGTFNELLDNNKAFSTFIKGNN